MPVNTSNKSKYIDTTNVVYYLIADFFNIIYKHYLNDGETRDNARELAFDAVELRYNIKRERTRSILIGTRKSPKDISKYRPLFYQENKDLIELLKIINNEYANNGRDK